METSPDGDLITDDTETERELSMVKSMQLKNLKQIVERRKRYDSLMKGCSTSRAADVGHLPSFDHFRPIPNEWLKKHGTGPGFHHQLTRHAAKKNSGNGGYAIMNDAGFPYEPETCMDSFKSKAQHHIDFKKQTERDTSMFLRNSRSPLPKRAASLNRLRHLPSMSPEDDQIISPHDRHAM
jgi:hypothetical protein